MRLTASRRDQARPAKTASEQLAELRARLAELRDVRFTALLEAQEEVLRLESASEEETRIARAVEVASRVVDDEIRARDEIRRLLAEADRLDTEAVDLAERGGEAAELRLKLDTARAGVAVAERRYEQLRDAIGLAVASAAPRAEIARLESESAEVLAAISETANVDSLERALSEVSGAASEAERLQGLAAALRDQAHAAEDELPGYLEDRRVAHAHQVVSEEERRWAVLLRRGRRQPLSPTDQGFIANDGFAVTQGADGKLDVVGPLHLPEGGL